MNTWSVNTEGYPFSWLDEVVEVTLNPERTNLKLLSSTDLADIRDRLPAETDRIISCIKTQAFYLYSIDHIKVVAGHYDQAIQVLQRQTQANFEQYPRESDLFQTGQLILSSLEALINNIRNRYKMYLPSPECNSGGSLVIPQSANTKIMCKLSVDQIGLLLKSADDTRLIISRSLSLIFKMIVPFLSTESKKNISWDSMRSSSYRPEVSDKEAAINALEKLIGKIKEY